MNQSQEQVRYAAIVEYDGSAFCGWQTQSHAPSAQAELEKALSKVANESIEVVCAGRTDTGVHAMGQVIHFDSPVHRPSHNWIMGVRSNAKRSIGLQWIRRVDEEFHARYSATGRHYRYVILNRAYTSPLWRDRSTHVVQQLDEARMQEAANHLLGEHDFSAFRASACQAKHARRNLLGLTVSRKDDVVTIDVHANAFLHHMVRNIAGTLMVIGKSEQPSDWMKELLEGRNRAAAAATAPATGLFFMSVDYPERFGIPAPARIPDFSSFSTTDSPVNR